MVMYSEPRSVASGALLVKIFRTFSNKCHALARLPLVPTTEGLAIRRVNFVYDGTLSIHKAQQKQLNVHFSRLFNIALDSSVNRSAKGLQMSYRACSC